MKGDPRRPYAGAPGRVRALAPGRENLVGQEVAPTFCLRPCDRTRSRMLVQPPLETRGTPISQPTRNPEAPPGLSDLLAYPTSWSIIKLRQRGFWDGIGNFDPVPYWQRLSVDSLILYGENDMNVPSSKSTAILRSLGNPNINVRIYEGSGHALESPEGRGKSIFREDALRDIRDFVFSSTSTL